MVQLLPETIAINRNRSRPAVRLKRRWGSAAPRALLDITQPELTEAAGLGLSTIVDFEKSRRDTSRAAVHAMQEALEKAGVRFIEKDGGGPAFDWLAERPVTESKVFGLQAATGRLGGDFHRVRVGK
jgi:hypothetical protein